jgi:hypothetical protein
MAAAVARGLNTHARLGDLRPSLQAASHASAVGCGAAERPAMAAVMGWREAVSSLLTRLTYSTMSIIPSTMVRKLPFRCRSA